MQNLNSGRRNIFSSAFSPSYYYLHSLHSYHYYILVCVPMVYPWVSRSCIRWCFRQCIRHCFRWCIRWCIRHLDKHYNLQWLRAFYLCCFTFATFYRFLTTSKTDKLCLHSISISQIIYVQRSKSVLFVP